MDVKIFVNYVLYVILSVDLMIITMTINLTLEHGANNSNNDNKFDSL